MKKFQGDAGVSETMPTLHRDTRKHPYGNPKWRNLRMSLGFDGMNDNQKERYIEDRDAIAEWNNRPISELTEEEQTNRHELESAKRMHIETLEEILPEGMKIEDWINNLRLREQDEYKRVYNDILNNTHEKPKKQDGGVLPEYQPGGGNIVKNAIKKIIPNKVKRFRNSNPGADIRAHVGSGNYNFSGDVAVPELGLTAGDFSNLTNYERQALFNLGKADNLPDPRFNNLLRNFKEFNDNQIGHELGNFASDYPDSYFEVMLPKGKKSALMDEIFRDIPNVHNARHPYTTEDYEAAIEAAGGYGNYNPYSLKQRDNFTGEFEKNLRSYGGFGFFANNIPTMGASSYTPELRPIKSNLRKRTNYSGNSYSKEYDLNDPFREGYTQYHLDQTPGYSYMNQVSPTAHYMRTANPMGNIDPIVNAAKYRGRGDMDNQHNFLLSTANHPSMILSGDQGFANLSGGNEQRLNWANIERQRPGKNIDPRTAEIAPLLRETFNINSPIEGTFMKFPSSQQFNRLYNGQLPSGDLSPGGQWYAKRLNEEYKQFTNQLPTSSILYRPNFDFKKPFAQRPYLTKDGSQFFDAKGMSHGWSPDNEMKDRWLLDKSLIRHMIEGRYDPNRGYKEGGSLPEYQPGGGNSAKQAIKQFIKSPSRFFKSQSIGKGLTDTPLTVPLNYNTPLASNIINHTSSLPANGFGNINQEALVNWDAAVLNNNFSKQADNFKLDIPLTRVLDSKGISIRDGKLFSKTGDHYYAPDFTSSRNTTHWSYGHIGDPGHGQWSKYSTAIISDFKTLKESGHAMDFNPTDTYFYSKDDFKIPDNSLILTRDKSLYDKIRLQTDLVNVKWVDPTQVDDEQFKALVDSYSTNGPEKYNYQGDLFNDYLHSNWKKGINVAQYKPASYLSKNQKDFFGGGQSKMHGLDPLSDIESIQKKGYMKNHGLYSEIGTWKGSEDFGKGIGTLDAMLEWPKPMQVLEMEKLLRLYKHKPEALRVQTELANLNGFKTYKEFKDSVSKAEMDNFKRYGGEQLPKAQFGKGLKKLQQKIRDNRVANTPVRDATSEEVLEMLSSFGPDSPMLQGEYDPREKEIVMYKDDLDTLKHEQVHASQYGPLQRMWYKMNDNGNDPAYKGARIQNKPMRKAYKQLTKGKNQVQDLLLPDNEKTFNAAGQYVLNTGEEFEAVLNTGINAAKLQGVSFNSSFDDIYSQLLNIKNPTNNMRGLTKFMSNKFTDAQKDIIFKAIQDEMPPAVPLPVMNSKS